MTGPNLRPGPDPRSPYPTIAEAMPSALLDRPIPGSWYVNLGTPSTAVIASGGITGGWLFVPVATPVDRIGCEVTTAGAAGDQAFLSLYRKTPGSTVLTRVMAETAALDLSSTGFKEEAISQTLEPGRYAALIRAGTLTGAPQVRNRLAAQWPGFYPADTIDLSSDNRGGIHWTQLGLAPPVASPVAALTLQLGTRAYAPMIYLRAA